MSEKEKLNLFDESSTEMKDFDDGKMWWLWTKKI